MEYAADTAPDTAQITGLFRTAFTSADNPGEGALVADLADRLLALPASTGVRLFTARSGSALAGAILFSPLNFAKDSRPVALLSPVAVAPDWQRKGVGSGLIRHGLEQLKQDGTSIAATYGDPAYYGRFGFCQISTGQLPAPHPLSQPAGWQAQSLSGAGGHAGFTPLRGACSCLAPFDDPALW